MEVTGGQGKCVRALECACVSMRLQRCQAAALRVSARNRVLHCAEPLTSHVSGLNGKTGICLPESGAVLIPVAQLAEQPQGLAQGQTASRPGLPGDPVKIQVPLQ